jgi:hypothetical protein
VTSGNRVVVFSKTTCPHCRAAKKLLRECGVDDVLIIETDQGDGEFFWPQLLHARPARAASQEDPVYWEKALNRRREDGRLLVLSLLLFLQPELPCNEKRSLPSLPFMRLACFGAEQRASATRFTHASRSGQQQTPSSSV